jgi:hyperosmotically inducible protein
MNASDAKGLEFWPKGAGQGHLPLGLCVCALLVGLLTKPLFAQGGQTSAVASQSSVEQGQSPDSKSTAKPQNNPSVEKLSSQESTPAQPENQISSNEEPTSKGEEAAETNETTKKTVSSLILTVKLALLADPRLFPYEIEVEAASNVITLSGKVPTETEKVAAAKIATAVPTVKSVANKLKVDKELVKVLAHKQDEIITHYVKEQFAKSTTVKAANFAVSTEKGVVSLTGTVRFQVIVLEAAEAARLVPGVKAVKTDSVRIESEG